MRDFIRGAVKAILRALGPSPSIDRIGTSTRATSTPGVAIAVRDYRRDYKMIFPAETENG